MSEKNTDFIRRIIDEDLAAGKYPDGLVTRFPPEPNGYLHVGHAKSICLNFGIAEAYANSVCNLRFDDTNPGKENVEYVDSIREDVKWLGFDPGDRVYFASDYFERLYAFAEQLIKDGKAYVCGLSADDIRRTRGTLTEPGTPSPDRNRPAEENLDLFRRMRAGEFADGTYILRAKIDMASPTLCLRDPAIYRIRHESHHRTGDKWCIYPMYDFAHPLSDAIEGVTHSLCTLEFANNRPLYDWFVEQLTDPPRPKQTEFARLNLTYTVLSKRKLSRLVSEGFVSGWDDPRMPTIAGIRRRGVPPGALRNFCDLIGIAKKESLVDVALLEYAVREQLNKTAPRRMAVIHPLKVVIENYPEGEGEEMTAVNNPEDPDAGTRMVPFSRELYIEADDFMEEPPKKFFRLAPGREVRLRYAYFIKCESVIKDASGNIVELRCTYDPATRGGDAPDGRKVKATLHWVSARHAVAAEVRLYDRLFLKENPSDDEGRDFTEFLNPDSLQPLFPCFLEPALTQAAPCRAFQFERLGYFCADAKDATPDRPVFNRTVTLRDTWARIQKQEQKG
ncbi:glutamine--tRNA ligase/YqeY domain fusion protein [Desulfosudis oleivorans]|uniref:Glutamine--tRNA ligase n=1 Tax=Desulfosudis oleivorans (strain DSM 6200 / JCM 39069 / Hxd3) TaxID=96561 RepID=A8ZZZ9_DESOH|nr:glutamine--tRNA ligase/YqeY domain fusion protein [Desulfosudis oleivorans]ABW67399.1 glutaminyl-tRNA synthetase [Desulfosudis oleivorans Hxd3]